MSICTVALLRHGGSHLIRPIVDKLGFDIVEPGNFDAPLDKAIGPVIVFLRDPRDRMVSTMRWWRGKPRKVAIMQEGKSTDDAQLKWLLDSQHFLAEMLEWARIWCRWTPSYVARFETIDATVVSEMASFLGLDHNPDRDKQIFESVYGHGRTYTGSHSKWRDHFGPLALDYWNNNGGDKLLSLMGYV